MGRPCCARRAYSPIGAAATCCVRQSIVWRRRVQCPVGELVARIGHANHLRGGTQQADGSLGEHFELNWLAGRQSLEHELPEGEILESFASQELMILRSERRLIR